MKQKQKTRWLIVALFGLVLPVVSLAASSPKEKFDDLTAKAISDEPAISAPAIAALRAAGPVGLEALMCANAQAIANHNNLGSGPTVDASWSRVTAALDAVGAQRNDYSSGLYWYTDLAAAEAAAKASGKPILSLRLLGNLSDEYSCANSRFFRTVLYANSQVSKELRENFILHWQSVRPVPIITIDFGDGRKIRRTITGNSIHYVLTGDGQVVDAIPGLYGPKAFLSELAEARQAVANISDKSDFDRAAALRQWHENQISRISDAFDADEAKIKKEQTLPADQLTDADWEKIADLHTDDAALDRRSRELMAVKNPTADQAGRLAYTKRIVESPLLKMMWNFQKSIAQDTVRNQYTFHLQLHRWLADPAAAKLFANVDSLNHRVYSELFLTPESDPWLGLVPANTYSALDNDGLNVVEPSSAKASTPQN